MATMRRGKIGIVAGSAMLLALVTATLTGFEGRRTVAYQDVVGVWTICDGWTEGVRKGDRATPERCDELLRDGVARYERELDACLTTPLPGRTKVALISWAWNIGTGAACKSTLVKLGNAGRLEAMCAELPRWNKGGKPLVVVSGLVKRRAAEKAMCLEGLREAGAVAPADAGPDAAPTAPQRPDGWGLWLLVGLVTAGVLAGLVLLMRRPGEVA